MKCTYCGASDTMLVKQAIETMKTCNNCMVDLTTGGQWTGIAIKLLKSLISQYGKEAVVLELEKQNRKDYHV